MFFLFSSIFINKYRNVLYFITVYPFSTSVVLGKIKPISKEDVDMSLLFIQYPPCSTCKKAKAWLDQNNQEYQNRSIKEQNPAAEELKAWHKKSGLPLKRFFNTSGVLYKEMGLKDKLASMTEEEQFALLATDGMLVKRPLLIGDDFVLVGFKDSQWKETLT